jgi:hypothetical protein
MHHRRVNFSVSTRLALSGVQVADVAVVLEVAATARRCWGRRGPALVLKDAGPQGARRVTQSQRCPEPAGEPGVRFVLALGLLKLTMARAAPRRPTSRIQSRVPGAVRAPHPGFIEPCLATLRAKPPIGEGWLYEIKLDGSSYSVIVISSPACGNWGDLKKGIFAYVAAR